MLIDFRKAPAVTPDLFPDGVKVERVTEYKYLGIVLDNKLNLNKNIDFIHKRCQPRIFCLQKLRSLNVDPAVLRTFCCFTHFLLFYALSTVLRIFFCFTHFLLFYALSSVLRTFLLFYALSSVLRTFYCFTHFLLFYALSSVLRTFYCFTHFLLFYALSTVLHTFYQSCIESILTFSFLCWFGALSVKRKIS